MPHVVSCLGRPFIASFNMDFHDKKITYYFLRSPISYDIAYFLTYFILNFFLEEVIHPSVAQIFYGINN